MALQLRRGLEADRDTITPAAGELIYTTDKKEVFVGDGTTLGGVRVTPLPTIIDGFVQYTAGTGGDFPDIYSAVEFMNACEVTGTGRLHVALLPGTYTLNKSLVLSGNWRGKVLGGGVAVAPSIINNLATPLVTEATSLTITDTDRRLKVHFSAGYGELNTIYKNQLQAPVGHKFHLNNRNLAVGDIVMFNRSIYSTGDTLSPACPVIVQGTTDSIKFSRFLAGKPFVVDSITGDAFVLVTKNVYGFETGALPAFTTGGPYTYNSIRGFTVTHSKIKWDTNLALDVYYDSMIIADCVTGEDYWDPSAGDPLSDYTSTFVGWIDHGLQGLAILGPSEDNTGVGNTGGWLPWAYIYSSMMHSSIRATDCIFASDAAIAGNYDNFTYVCLYYKQHGLYRNCFIEAISSEQESLAIVQSCNLPSVVMLDGGRTTMGSLVRLFKSTAAGPTNNTAFRLDGGSLSLFNGCSVVDDFVGTYVESPPDETVDNPMLSKATVNNGYRSDFPISNSNYQYVKAYSTNTVLPNVYLFPSRIFQVSGNTTITLPGSAEFTGSRVVNFVKTDTNTLTLAVGAGGGIIGTTTTTKPGHYTIYGDVNNPGTWYSPF